MAKAYRIGLCLAALIGAAAPVGFVAPHVLQHRDAPSRERHASTVIEPASQSRLAEPTVPTNGIIRGSVVAVGDRRPLRHALVSLTGPIRRERHTDDLGEFEFDDVPYGEYVVSAARAGYINQTFGQREPLEPPQSVVVSKESAVRSVSFALRPGLVVSGIVSDHTGQPVPSAAVRLLHVDYSSGVAELGLVPGTTMVRTDDRGVYRLSGVPPGKYLLSASLNGTYFERKDSRPYAFPEMFLPGTTDYEDASEIELVKDSNWNLTLQPRRVVYVTGRVTNSRDMPVTAGIVRLVKTGRTTPAALTQIHPNGTYTLETSASPGDYVVIATTRSMTISPGPGEGVELGRVSLTLADADIKGTPIRTRPGVTISGEVVVDTGEQAVPLPRLRLYARPVKFDGTLIGSEGVAVEPSGKFRLRNVFDTSWILPDLTPESGWYIKAVYAGGVDVTSQGIAVTAATRDITDVRVVLSRNTIRLDGEVRTPRGGVASDAIVVVFADEPSKWTASTGSYVRWTRAAERGEFELRGLIPGSYRVAAVETASLASIRAPQFLSELRRQSRTAKLEARTTSNVRLKLTQQTP